MQEFWAQQNCGFKQILCEKSFWVKKSFGPKKILGQNKFVGLNKFWIRKSVESEKFWTQQNFGLIFGVFVSFLGNANNCVNDLWMVVLSSLKVLTLVASYLSEQLSQLPNKINSKTMMYLLLTSHIILNTSLVNNYKNFGLLVTTKTKETGDTSEDVQRAKAQHLPFTGPKRVSKIDHMLFKNPLGCKFLFYNVAVSGFVGDIPLPMLDSKI